MLFFFLHRVESNFGLELIAMIIDGIKFYLKKVKDKSVYLPEIENSKIEEFWAEKENYLIFLKANSWVKTNNDLRKYFSGIQKQATRRGFLRELPLEFNRSEKFIDPTEDELRTELLKYDSRSSCAPGLISTIYKKRWNHLLDERFPTHATQDRDIFYIIKLNHFEDDYQLVKVGVSSFHLGEQRVKKFQKEGYDFEDDPTYWYSLAAVDVERFALNLGKEASFEFKFDGYTEHRLFNQNDFIELEEYLVGRGAVSVLDFTKPPKGYKRVIKKITNVIKFKDGYAARENRSKQIAVFKTKFDAVLCKGLHLEGEDKRSFAIEMTNFRETPLWQDKLRNTEPHVRQTKPKKKAPLLKPVSIDSNKASFDDLNIPKNIVSSIEELNKKRSGIHKKDKDKFLYSLKTDGTLFTLLGENRFGHITTIGVTKHEKLAKYFCQHCNINGHDKLMKQYFSQAKKYFDDSIIPKVIYENINAKRKNLETQTENKLDIESELDAIFSKVFNTLDELIIKEKK